MLTRLAAPILTVLLLTAIAVPPAAGTGLPLPADRVILSVSGNITTTNVDGRADFDRAMLEALGVTRMTTWTPFTDGDLIFEGVLGITLLDAVGARGTTVTAIAINDYQADIPVADFRNYRVLLATRMAGTHLRLRDKGPIWIVFPWGEHPELDDQATRMKSVWQVSRFVVR